MIWLAPQASRGSGSPTVAWLSLMPSAAEMPPTGKPEGAAQAATPALQGLLG
jgi:hypothetical protein